MIICNQKEEKMHDGNTLASVPIPTHTRRASLLAGSLVQRTIIPRRSILSAELIAGIAANRKFCVAWRRLFENYTFVKKKEKNKKGG